MLKDITPTIMGWNNKEYRAFAFHKDGHVVLIDPLALDAEEEAQVRALGTVAAIVITGSYHEREAPSLGRKFGAPVYAHPECLPALHAKNVAPLPASLPLGLEAVHLPGAEGGQIALYDPENGGSLVVGDAWHNFDLLRIPWPLRLFLKHVIKLRHGLHPIPLRAQRDLAAYARSNRQLLERPVERLLVSHGAHLLAGAGDRMRERVEQGP